MRPKKDIRRHRPPEVMREDPPVRQGDLPGVDGHESVRESGGGPAGGSEPVPELMIYG